MYMHVCGMYVDVCLCVHIMYTCMHPSVYVCMGACIYECMYAHVQILNEIKFQVLRLLPASDIGLCEAYISQFQLVASQLRSLVYKTMCPQIVQQPAVRACASMFTNADCVCVCACVRVCVCACVRVCVQPGCTPFCI